MDGLSTKQRILENAMLLFDRHGIANVRLAQIADETGISVGNLAYHFKNKEAIVEMVYEQVCHEFVDILGAYLRDPSLFDFDTQVHRYVQFFSRHRFVLLNVFEIERSYPKIHQQWQRCTARMLTQIRKRLDFFVETGLLQPEPGRNDYALLANSIWLCSTFWLPQQVLLGKNHNPDGYRKLMWSLLFPHLTEQGRTEYESAIRPLVHQG